MDRRIHELEAEVEELWEFKKKYDDLVQENLKYSQDIAAGMLQLVFLIPSSRLGKEKE